MVSVFLSPERSLCFNSINKVPSAKPLSLTSNVSLVETSFMLPSIPLSLKLTSFMVSVVLFTIL